jgi:pimeloyl-ACP methyl ester carboxylesterase
MARRHFREGADGRPELDYDMGIAAPLRAAAAAGAPVPDLWPYFEALAAGRPLTVIRGATSDLLDRDTAAQMQARAPQTVVAEVPGIGHAPMLDEPDALAAVKAHLEAAA